MRVSAGKAFIQTNNGFGKSWHENLEIVRSMSVKYALMDGLIDNAPVEGTTSFFFNPSPGSRTPLESSGLIEVNINFSMQFKEDRT